MRKVSQRQFDSLTVPNVKIAAVGGKRDKTRVIPGSFEGGGILLQYS